MNNTKRSIISILSVIMLVGIIAGLVPSKNVNAAGPYLSKKLTITNSVNENLTGPGRPTVFYEDDCTHKIQGRVAGLKGNETICIKFGTLTKDTGYKGAYININAQGRKAIDINEVFQTNKWGDIWCGEYYAYVTVDNTQVGDTLFFSSIRRSSVKYIKDLNKFVDRNVSGICADAYNISIAKTTPADVARMYFKYSSFQTKSRSLSNKEYVKKLYICLLGRDYDQGGLDYWTNCLNAGQPREQVLEGFLNSAEFQNRYI